MNETIGKFTIIVKTSYDCNLSCKYCYEGQKPRQIRLSLELAKRIISACINQFPNKKLEFIWHGGEPLLLGQKFYEQIIEYQKELGKYAQIKNSIQTNGILLSDHFLDFLVSNNFNIGISLDGNKKIHDFQRVTRNHHVTFNQVFASFQRLKRANELHSRKSNPHALAVFTRNTLENIDEFYEFFKENKMSVKINPLMSVGNATDAKDLIVSPYEYGKALVYLFEKWVKEKSPDFSIEPFPRMIRSLATGKPETCIFSKACAGQYLSIDPEGNVTPCGRWGKDDYYLGNIETETLDSILSSPPFIAYQGTRNAMNTACGECRYVNICNGGCAFSGFMINRSLSEKDFYCESYFMLFESMEKSLRASIN